MIEASRVICSISCGIPSVRVVSVAVRGMGQTPVLIEMKYTEEDGEAWSAHYPGYIIESVHPAGLPDPVVDAVRNPRKWNTYTTNPWPSYITYVNKNPAECMKEWSE